MLWRLFVAGWDPLALAELGTLFSVPDPGGTEGYDGQFVYYIAVDPDPHRVQVHLDVPPYRYQRILLSALGRTLALGRIDAIPWVLLIINLTAHLIGTWAIASYLDSYDTNPAYALIYGLWTGLVMSVALDMNEPLAYSLVAIGWFARRRDQSFLSACLLTLALFSKETTILFWGAALLTDVLGKRRWRSVGFLLLGGAIFAAWQFWLWATFGSPGIGTGGANATSIEWIPFMGLWRIGSVSLLVLALYVVVFGPTIVLPTLWSIWKAIRTLILDQESTEAWALLFNSVLIVFLPFSTFREPLGLLRFSTGLVLALLLFVTSQKLRKPLNYGLFWIPLIAILVNG